MKSFIVCVWRGDTPVEVTDFVGVCHVNFLLASSLTP